LAIASVASRTPRSRNSLEYRPISLSFSLSEVCEKPRAVRVYTAACGAERGGLATLLSPTVAGLKAAGFSPGYVYGGVVRGVLQYGERWRESVAKAAWVCQGMEVGVGDCLSISSLGSSALSTAKAYGEAMLASCDR
jgi:hypothetical protein